MSPETRELLEHPDAQKLIERLRNLETLNDEKGKNDHRSEEITEIETKLAEIWGIDNPQALQEAMQRVFEHLYPDDMEGGIV